MENHLMRRATVAVAGMAGLAASIIALAGPAAARDQIQIVGSSTVFPYTQAVAERFAANTGAPSPVVESTGTGGGMQIFCEGIGTGFADLTGASRAMKASEWDLCKQNGVTNVTEILLGFDGLSMAVSQKGQALDLSKAQLFSALAAEVEVDGEVVANPYQRWSEIDASLPDIPILVYGPPPTSGTRDAWVELVMQEGCSEFAAIEALAEERMEEVCQRMRTDGPFVEAGENDNLIVQRLTSDSNAYGIFGYSFLYENQDQLKAVKIAGVAPNEETIESGEYGVSRPLFIYVKNDHRGVIPNLQEFIEEYVSDDAMGPGGYLSERGLIPLPEEKLQAVQAAGVEAAPMEGPSS
jgi:phosphate transport system substrate-binding protein